MKCILLSARRFDFQDSVSNKRVQGVTVQYIEGKPLQDADERGNVPLKITATAETWAYLRELPGVYDVEFKQRPGKDNRPTLTLTSVQFISPLVLGDCVEDSA